MASSTARREEDSALSAGVATTARNKAAVRARAIAELARIVSLPR
jgi:hypothetical protein